MYPKSEGGVSAHGIFPGDFNILSGVLPCRLRMRYAHRNPTEIPLTAGHSIPEIATFAVFPVRQAVSKVCRHLLFAPVIPGEPRKTFNMTSHPFSMLNALYGPSGGIYGHSAAD
jgi:hypothetical protein